MIVVCLVYPNGQRQEVLLAGTPRVGDHVRLANADLGDPSLIVEQVLWQEALAGKVEPYVIIVVRPHTAAAGV